MASHCYDIGPCRAYFDSHEFSPIHEQALLKIEETSVDVTNSENGETAVDKVTTGTKATVEMAITHASFADLAKIFTNTQTVSLTHFKLMNSVGKQKSLGKATLTLKPVVQGVPSTDQKTWTKLNNAVPMASVEVPFGKDGQRAWAVVFEALAPAVATDPMVELGAVTGT